MRVSAIELTGPKFSAHRVPAMVTVLRTPFPPDIEFDSHVHREFPMKNLIKRFANDESGATAIEYSLIAALIGVVLIAGATTLGTTIRDKFTSIATTIQGAGN